MYFYRFAMNKSCSEKPRTKYI